MKKFSKKYSKLALIILLVAIVLALIFSGKGNDERQVLGETTRVENQALKRYSTTEIFNYNFSVPTNSDNSSVKAANTDTEPKEAVKGSPNMLQIPKLNLETKIVEGVDGEAAINVGAWFYPSSYHGRGEKILLGHRRYWGADDPRSFWNLDQLKQGDEIYYSDSEGTVLTYKVRTTSVRNGDDLAILTPSKDNLLKVISCSTLDGSAGSSERRIVVIAELVE